jgi:hypothetical protein
MFFTQSNPLNKFKEPLPLFAVFDGMKIVEHLADKSGNGHPRVERCLRPLEDNLNMTAEKTQRLAFQEHKVLSVYDDFAGIGINQSRQASRKGGLAATALAHESDRFPGINLQGDLAKTRERHFRVRSSAKDLRQIADR